jgi:hypothetical protein
MSLQKNPDSKPQLICTCRISLRRNGAGLTVKTRQWDCPSCGLDKRRTLAKMVHLSNADAMWTFTMPQPFATDSTGQAVTPAEFANCDWYSHVYLYTDGSLRWRTLSTCSNCCRRVSRMFDTFTKWVRRRYPTAQRMWVREDQKNGSVHLHTAWVGVPFIANRSRAARRFRQAWVELGGGSQLDFGKPRGNSEWMGWYMGKYLAKQHEERMARGYRRWSRSRGFCPQITMGRYEPPEGREPGVIEILGWVDPFTLETRATRVLLPT